MTSPRVATATQHLSNNHDITSVALGGSAISPSIFWRHLLSLFYGFYFGSTFSLHSKTSSRIDFVVSKKLSVLLFCTKLIIIYFRRTRRSGAARHIFTLHIIESEHLTPHAKKRVQEKIEKVCLFVQEIANFKVYKRAPDEIKIAPDEISSGRNPIKL